MRLLTWGTLNGGAQRLKRLRNTSGIPNEQVTQVVGWIAGVLGITQFDVECRSSQSVIVGRAYTEGARSYHGNRRPFVVLRVGTDTIERWKTTDGTRTVYANIRSHLKRATKGTYPVKVSQHRFPTTITPYQYRQHKGKRYVLANRMEALVYIAAHELRHLWQAARLTDRRKSAPLPMAWGSKGKYSEVDTEAFAIHTLRAWRKKQNDSRSL